MIRAIIPAGVLACTCFLPGTPLCAADPAEPSVDPAPPEVQTGSTTLGFSSGLETGNPVTDACRLFDAALRVAAVNYEDFAYATAGSGNYVNYEDPIVVRTNVIGRTALRQAAAAALSASRTVGLPPDVSDPMRTWSLRATKLVVVMGLHGGGDTLNNSVSDLNSDGQQAQTACALAQRG